MKITDRAELLSNLHSRRAESREEILDACLEMGKITMGEVIELSIQFMKNVYKTEWTPEIEEQYIKSIEDGCN